MTSRKFVQFLKPLEDEVNDHELTGELGNTLYSRRILTALVLRFAKSETFNYYVVTISPRNNVINSNTVFELDKLLITLSEQFAGLHAIYYPEVSENDRYHYHGFVICSKEQSANFSIYMKFLERRIGNSYFQRILSLTDEYKAYNAKTKTDQTTKFEQIITYITKQVNYKKLLEYINADNKYSNKLLQGKGSKDRKVTSVVTTFKITITDWIKDFYDETHEDNIEI